MSAAEALKELAERLEISKVFTYAEASRGREDVDYKIWVCEKKRDTIPQKKLLAKGTDPNQRFFFFFFFSVVSYEEELKIKAS